jgi:hypothetical protein
VNSMVTGDVTLDPGAFHRCALWSHGPGRRRAVALSAFTDDGRRRSRGTRARDPRRPRRRKVEGTGPLALRAVAATTTLGRVERNAHRLPRQHPRRWPGYASIAAVVPPTSLAIASARRASRRCRRRVMAERKTRSRSARRFLHTAFVYRRRGYVVPGVRTRARAAIPQPAHSFAERWASIKGCVHGR